MCARSFSARENHAVASSSSARTMKNARNFLKSALQQRVVRPNSSDSRQPVQLARFVQILLANWRCKSY